MRKCRISATGSTRRTLRVSVTSCSLLLLSIVVKNVDKFRLTGGLGRGPVATRIPVVFLATQSARGSALAKFGLNTSSCVSGPFSVHRIVMHVHTMLHHATRRGNDTSRPGIVNCRKLILSLSEGAIDVSNRTIPFAGARFRLLRLLLRRGNEIFSHRRLVSEI